MIRDRNRLFIEHSPKEMLLISARLLMTMSLIALANLVIFWLFVLQGQISAILVHFTLTLLLITQFCTVFIYFARGVNENINKTSPASRRGKIRKSHKSQPSIGSQVTHGRPSKKPKKRSKKIKLNENKRKDSSDVVVLAELAEHLLGQREAQALENIEVFVTYNYEAKDNSKTQLESFLRPVDLTEITVYEVIP